ncbi:MAG: tetratricopeptide repeat protein [Phycisphaerales bacterium]|nr:MAG: tetratricopeptide repeat protein [Phycisphaerales bacterium]
MVKERRCRKCRAELPVDAPQEACPQCLMQLGLPSDADVTIDELGLSEGPGTAIGRYKLLEKIGEGGMAVVYMAEQKEPINRRVALKIIKLGMDTRQVIARFEAERQALAMMDHPNVAKVFDAGATDTGRPYFVMEMVKGISITEYCDKQKLSTRERLRLFVQVCGAVEHAHQKGIIHRDLKPANILVTLHDGTPVPKVIDFGISKATNQRLTEKTLFTRYAQLIGTPEYMSPEQAEMSGLDVDTRTDVYSLGVLLYELLAGALPFDPDALRSDQGRYQDAERPMTEALNGRRKTLGEDHPDTFRSMNSLGLLYRRQGKLNQAEKLLVECYDRARETLGEERLSTMQYSADLGILYYKQGKIREAEALVFKALDILRRILGHENPAVLGLMHDVGLWYLNFGRDVEAEKLLVEALEGRRRVLGEEHPDTQATMGVVHFIGSQYEKAEPLLLKAMENERLVEGRETPPFIMYSLASLYNRKGRYDKAEPLLVEFLEISQRVLIDGHPDTVAAMNELIKLYKAWNKPEEADRWRAKLPQTEATEK